VALGPKYRQKVRDAEELMALLQRARDSHDAAVRRGQAEPFGPYKIIGWTVQTRAPAEKGHAVGDVRGEGGVERLQEVGDHMVGTDSTTVSPPTRLSSS